ncbi:MAG: ABC transporter permease [Mycoplasmataceae bacterium]|nr:ABC transporter permease [Mycoplasmataceae bacterium]
MNKFLFSFEKIKYSNHALVKNFLIMVLMLFLSLLLALILSAFIYHDASLIYKIFISFFTSAFSSYSFTNNTIGTIAIFSVLAIGFIIPVKCGLFNIGISGQMLFGGAMATILANHAIDMPNGISQIVLLFIGIISGTAIGIIIGVLKAYLKVNEIVSSIVISWILFYLSLYFLSQFCVISEDQAFTKSLLHLQSDAFSSYNLVLQTSSGESWIPLLIIAILVIIGAVVLIYFTVFGKKIIITGKSFETSRFSGFNINTNTIITLSISGALAGLAGVMLYLGNTTSMSIQTASKALPTHGFVGISIGLISFSNPFFVLPIATLFGIIDGAKSNLQVLYGIDPSIADIIFGITVYASAITSIFTYFHPIKWILFKLNKKTWYEQKIEEKAQRQKLYDDVMILLKTQKYHNEERFNLKVQEMKAENDVKYNSTNLIDYYWKEKNKMKENNK